MDTWVDAQALYDIGLKQIKEGLKNIHKSYDMVEKINGKKENDLSDNRESRHGDERSQEGRR